MSQPAITIYSADWCPYCQRAKALLTAKKLTFTAIDVDGDPRLRDEMIARSAQHTVPQIFIGDKHIGGCDELAALERRGELDRLMEVVR